jgi:hypothetical protein
MKKIYTIIALSALLALFCGCASPRPVLYPNKHYLRVGKERAELDIKTAMAMAEKHGLNSSNYAKGGKKLAVGTGAGAATGVAVGAATGGLICWLFSESSPSPMYKRFVEIYLEERGYKVIGWK